MKITVPGNLLLFGEYAITYPGGLGIAVATDAKVVVESSPADQLSISGTFGNKTYRWTEGSPFPSPLVEYIVKTLNVFPSRHIHIDSSAFYYPDGRKKGYGSSAAVTIGLACALLEPADKEALLAQSLKLHRGFQGGKGSGYDIYASCNGGAGLFKGGEVPTWEPLQPGLFQTLHLLRGEHPCDTRQALQHLQQFEKQKPNDFTDFLNRSNAMVNDLSHSLESFQKSIELNHWINARLPQELPWREETIKPLGAGGEIGATLSPLPDSEPLIISQDGIQWQQ